MIFIMALPKGTKRYKHNVTGEIRYFKNAPNLNFWTKVGTPGSKNWRWINNTIEEKYVHAAEPIPEGYSLGRVRG